MWILQVSEFIFGGCSYNLPSQVNYKLLKEECNSVSDVNFTTK